MMKTIQIPYYTSSLDLHVEESNLEAVITAKTDSFDPGMSEAALGEQALANPIGTPRLRELAKGRKKVTLVTSDHTRAVRVAQTSLDVELGVVVGGDVLVRAEVLIEDGVSGIGHRHLPGYGSANTAQGARLA